MYLAIGGKINIYDLVTKECLFKFSSFAESHLVLYDYDEKLIVCDRQQLRLWNFQRRKEEIPQLVTVLETPLKVECLAVNKFAEESGER
jgi:hypothetical protein